MFYNLVWEGFLGVKSDFWFIGFHCRLPGGTFCKGIFPKLLAGAFLLLKKSFPQPFFLYRLWGKFHFFLLTRHFNTNLRAGGGETKG